MDRLYLVALFEKNKVPFYGTIDPSHGNEDRGYFRRRSHCYRDDNAVQRQHQGVCKNTPDKDGKNNGCRHRDHTQGQENR